MTDALTNAPHTLALHDLEIVEKIGAGGFAVVYRARHRLDPERQYAVKALHRRVREPDERRRFERECTALGRLAGTRGIVRLHAAEVDEAGWAHIVTDLYQTTYAERVRSLGSLTPDETIEAGLQVARALAATHAAGIVHGDVKPNNLFLDHAGQVYLGDFGAAEVDDTTIDSIPPFSLRYCAPEVLEQGQTGEAADVYGLGATLHQLVTGDPPPGPGADDLGDVPPGLARIIRQLLVRRPARRPDAAGAAAALAQLQSGGTVDGDRPDRADRRRWPLAVAVVIGIGIIAAGILLNQGPTADDRPPAGDDAALGPTTTEGTDGDDATVTALVGEARALPDPGSDSDETGADASDGSIGDGEDGDTDEPEPPPAGDGDPDSGAPSSTTDDPGSGDQPGPPSSGGTEPTATTPSTTERPASTTTEPPPGGGGPCPSGVFCDSFDDGLANWGSLGGSEILDISVTSAGFNGPGLGLTPGQETVRGQKWLDRSIGYLPSDAVSVRFRVQVTDPGGPSYWMSIVEVRDQIGREWAINLQYTGPDSYLIWLRHWGGPSDTSGNVKSGSFSVGTWQCVVMTILPDSSQSFRLAIDGRSIGALDRPFPGVAGDRYELRLGSSWVDGAAPTVVLDDVAAGPPGSISC